MKSQYLTELKVCDYYETICCLFNTRSYFVSSYLNFDPSYIQILTKKTQKLLYSQQKHLNKVVQDVLSFHIHHSPPASEHCMLQNSVIRLKYAFVQISIHMQSLS